jgi:hypothetical protein
MLPILLAPMPLLAATKGPTYTGALIGAAEHEQVADFVIQLSQAEQDFITKTAFASPDDVRGGYLSLMFGGQRKALVDTG